MKKERNYNTWCECGQFGKFEQGGPEEGGKKCERE